MGVILLRRSKRILALLVWGLGAWSAKASPLETQRAFLKQFCLECHGAEKQKGDYRFDTLGADLSDLKTLEVWQGILATSFVVPGLCESIWPEVSKFCEERAFCTVDFCFVSHLRAAFVESWS